MLHAAPFSAPRLNPQTAMQVTRSHLKMATVVEGCTELLSCYTDEGQKSPFPLMRVDGNIYVLPGVPSVMRSKWPHIKKYLLEMYRSASFKNRSALKYLQVHRHDVCASFATMLACGTAG